MYDLEFSDSAMTTWTMLRQTWTAVNKMAEVKLAKVGLTPEKAAVLWLCRDYSGTLTPAEIARYLFRENQTIAGLLNRMESEGLVKRVPKRKGHPFTGQFGFLVDIGWFANYSFIRGWIFNIADDADAAAVHDARDASFLCFLK